MSDEPALTCDGFDEAIVGITEHQPRRRTLVVYDVEKMIAILMDRDGLSYEDAEEFLNFNTFGAWVGEGTPLFLRFKPPDVSIEEYLSEAFSGDV